MSKSRFYAAAAQVRTIKVRAAVELLHKSGTAGKQAWKVAYREARYAINVARSNMLPAWQYAE